MPQSQNIDLIRKAGTDAVRAVARHRDHVLTVHRKYDAESKGGKINRAAAGLYRQSEVLDLALSDPPDFDALPEKRLLQSHKDMLLQQEALFAEVDALFDPRGSHQIELQKALLEEPLTRDEADTYETNWVAMRGAITGYSSALAQAGVTEPEPSDDPKRTLSATRQGGADDTHDKGDKHMTCCAETNQALEGLVDAVSRLQGGTAGGSSGLPGTANAYSAFETAIDQKLQLTLGIPSLTSESAHAMDREDLTSKLIDGLDRTVATTAYGGVSHFSFNPLLARGGLIGVEDFALGAQAVAAETIRNLIPVFTTNLHKLVPESVIGDQDEADDLRLAIEDGLSKLATEAGAELGVYCDWAMAIIDTIFRDLMMLADLYDIREPGYIHRDRAHRLDYADISFSKFIGKNVDAILGRISYQPAKDRVLADPDIGILTAEANDRAMLAMLGKLMLMAELILGRVELGPLLGRVRQLNNTLASSVIAARGALAAAGVSEGDQAATFNVDDQCSIDLRRLLAWIETESLTARPTLLRGDLNTSDLRRLHTARATQERALHQIITAEFATVTNNRYAQGRRQLTEVHKHLSGLVDLYARLVHASTDETHT